MLRDILMYMDKTFCQTSNLPLVYERCVSRFRESVVKNRGVNRRMREIMLEYVRRSAEKAEEEGQGKHRTTKGANSEQQLQMNGVACCVSYSSLALADLHVFH
jgi:hypothetical protein